MSHRSQIKGYRKQSFKERLEVLDEHLHDCDHFSPEKESAYNAVEYYEKNKICIVKP